MRCRLSLSQISLHLFFHLCNDFRRYRHQEADLSPVFARIVENKCVWNIGGGVYCGTKISDQREIVGVNF
ncbi:unnamed protein product [Trifolium pratense]|uniref:Uncharacterized protein n=1 Tax=Trifolium pratense TaxID=57577 RepID=A0ACB0KM01_TRIPR|nr:unnamed protein product [Trifolium pratense]